MDLKEKEKAAKQRYFDKVYEEAPVIECACGCGTLIKAKDRYARPKRFVSGHNGRKYDDPGEHKRAWNHRNRKARYDYKIKRLTSLKYEMVTKAGGKCKICGHEFNGNNGFVFDLHHIDPSKKKFSLNRQTLSRKSLKEVWEEFEKCELLCANCHRYLHHSK